MFKFHIETRVSFWTTALELNFFMTLDQLNLELISCAKCARLVEWREQVGREKRAAYKLETYWAKPVPGFGDSNARVLILGLAPGAHGSNRTGRMFTGDSSGNFLYPALYRAGFASSGVSVNREDGLELHDCYITAAGRCAPPDNKPTTNELQNCKPWLVQELELLPKVRVILALGKIAHDTMLEFFKLQKSKHPFGHALEYTLPDGKILLDSYHVSQQNTQTGKLTVEMFDAILERSKVLCAENRTS
jgi:uracil-DNA glycosylase